MPQIALPALEAIVSLNRCEAAPPDPVVTTVAPVRERRSLYLSTGDRLYAVNAADGTARWCQQVNLARTREVVYPPEVSVPPPPRMSFATPRVEAGVSDVDGQVYVSMYGWVMYTCAFAADDGALRWWTPTDAQVSGGHFMDWAIPLVRDGIVYSGTYALTAQDGSVLWRIGIDTQEEGPLALHSLADQTLYASTQRGIYAINAQDGQIHWRYRLAEPRYFSGPPVVSDRLLYVGVNGGDGYPPTGHCFALDVETGAEVWRYPMGSYSGAVVDDDTIYVSSGDRSLYALDTKSGALRWRHDFAALGHYPTAVAHDTLYIRAVEGVYALGGADGAVLWQRTLGNGPDISSRPPVILDGVVYLARVEKRRGALFALTAHDGAECWQTAYPSARSLALAQ